MGTALAPGDAPAPRAGPGRGPAPARGSRERTRAAAARTLLCLCTVLAATPGADARSPRRLIESGWDEPDPAFMRRHVAEMERTPFDGCVYHLSYPKPDSGSGNFTWECWGRRAFTSAELAPALEDLEATPFRRFKHNFLRFNATPADLDWFDDYGSVLANAALASRIAKAGRSKGIFLDLEQYQGPLFEYRKRDAGTRSWEAYAAQTRLRGRAVMDAFQSGFPDLTVFLTFGYSMPCAESGAGRRPLAECRYGLVAPFLDGMVDAARGRTRLVDGHELSYGERDPSRFRISYRRMKRELLPIVGDPAKYSRVFSFAFGRWMDNEQQKRGWNTDDPPRNYFRPETFGKLVRKALEASDEYVWIYSETPRWWSAEGQPVRVPAAYVKALRVARDAVVADP